MLYINFFFKVVFFAFLSVQFSIFKDFYFFNERKILPFLLPSLSLSLSKFLRKSDLAVAVSIFVG